MNQIISEFVVSASISVKWTHLKLGTKQFSVVIAYPPSHRTRVANLKPTERYTEEYYCILLEMNSSMKGLITLNSWLLRMLKHLAKQFKFTQT